MERLEVSRATVERVFDDLRDKYQAPLLYNNEAKGWHYSDQHYELPGLWFSAEQLASLLVIERVLEQLHTGFLADYLAQFKSTIKQLLGDSSNQAEAISSRIRLLPLANRATQYRHFPKLATSLMRQRKVEIDYYTRGKNEHRKRIVSPQRLVLYRDNWYLDAYCHLRNGLRSFAVDCIESADTLDEVSLQIAESELDKHLLETYGIFAQPRVDWAVLRFNSIQARWVKHELWHPDQIGKLLDDGSYELHIPFGSTTELVRDILKYGEHVEVISPPSLRQEVINRLQQALANYVVV